MKFRLSTLIMIIGALPLLSGCLSGNSTVDSLLGGGSGSTEPEIGNSAITFSPTVWDFGNVGLSPAFSDKAFVVTNTSSKEVFIGATEGSSGGFSFPTNTCTSSITPGGTCNLTVRFSPTSGGSHSTSVVVKYGVDAGQATKYNSSLSVTGSSNPDAPSNYVLNFVGSTLAQFSWDDNSSSETGYEVERCNGYSCGTTFVTASATTLAANSTSHSWTGLTEGTYYRFRIRATAASSQSNWLYGDTLITFGGLSTIDNGSGSADLTGIDCYSETTATTYVDISWNSISGASQYVLYETTSGTPNLVATIASPTTSKLLTSLPISTSKSYLVKVVMGTGLTSLNSTATTLTTSTFLPCVAVGADTFKNVTAKTGIYGPTGIHYYAGKLFVSDYYNHRVLIWNSMPSSTGDEPDVILGNTTDTSASGQELFQNSENNDGAGTGVTSSSLRLPYHLWAGSVGGTDKLIVADSGNHRVLIWNSIPTAHKTSADVVVGQANMNMSTANSGGTTKGLSTPQGVWSDGTRLFVADTSNQAVKIYNAVPTTNHVSPDVVLGILGDDGTTKNKLDNPNAVWSDGTKLLISDRDNHRVVIHNTIPASNVNAALSIGQTAVQWTGNSISSGTGANKFNSPRGLFYDSANDLLYVADASNHRVKVFNGIPAAQDASSDFVLGASNTLGSAGAQANRHNSPIGITGNGTGVFVGDFANNRVGFYNTTPVADATSMNFQIGQKDFGWNQPNFPYPTSGERIAQVNGISYDSSSGQFFVADTAHHRVLVYNSVPSSLMPTPDFVLGQASFSGDSAATSQTGLSSPKGLCIAGGKLWVVDSGNHRVLAFSLPINTNAQPAVAVLGQASWATATTGTAKNKFNSPRDCAYDSTNDKFYVVDNQRHRVLMWSTLPNPALVTDNPAAAYYLGVNGTAGITQNRLDEPDSVAVINGKIFVADRDNHRVIAWNSPPTSDSPLADFVLGQLNFTSETAATSAYGMSQPYSVLAIGTRLYVADSGNRRIIYFDNPTSTYEAASGVIGQSSLSASVYNVFGSIGLSGYTSALGTDGFRLFFADSYKARVLGIPKR